MDELHIGIKVVDYIPIEQLEDGAIYDVNARNFSHALWNKKENRFFGIREKWGDVYIDSELHWDSSDTHGTVKPIRKIGKFGDFCPRCGLIENEKLMKYLEELE